MLSFKIINIILPPPKISVYILQALYTFRLYRFQKSIFKELICSSLALTINSVVPVGNPVKMLELNSFFIFYHNKVTHLGC